MHIAPDPSKGDSERCRVALEVSRTGTYRLDADDETVDWDDYLCALCGIEPKDFPRSYAAFLAKIHPEDRQRAAFAVAEALRTERDLDLVLRICRPDGQVVWLNNKARYFKNKVGQHYLLGACTDISSFKTVEAELVRAKEDAEQANRTKNLFLANVSHELRTPLTAMLGFAEILYAEAHEDFTKRHLEIIIKNGRHLADIVGEILDFASIEAGTLSSVPSAVSLSGLLNEMQTLFRHSATAKGLTVTVAPMQALPASIYLDPRRYRQILTNLVDNAIKFTLHGRIEVFVHLAHDPEDPDACTVETFVTDTGCGIRADAVQRIFKPFVRAEDSYASGIGGTGLGLPLARSLARAMGGDVTLVRSIPGQGSVFRATIKAQRVRPGSAAPSPSGSETQGLGLSGSLSGRRILLVEDTADSQALICAFLRPTGAELTISQSGEDAVRKLRDQKFDAVLMDLRMPGLDGYATLSLMQQQSFHKPVIAVTAHAGAHEKKRAAAAGFAGYVTKPIDRIGLINLIVEQTRL